MMNRGHRQAAVRSSSALARAWERHPVRALLAHRRRVALLRQLQSLNDAGVGLQTGLDEISRLAGRAAGADDLRRASDRMAAGASLAEALREAGLDDASLGLLAAAEESGTLGDLLPRLIARLDGEQADRFRLLVNFAYPAALLAVLLVAGPLLELPAAMVRDPAADLPRLYATRLATNLMVAGAAMAFCFAGPLLPALLGCEAAWDRMRFSLPVLGRLHRTGCAGRFLGVLGPAVGAGLEIGRALRLALVATGSPSLRARTSELAARLRSGQTLAEALSILQILDPPALAQVAVAEKAGALAEVPARLSIEMAESRRRRARALAMAAAAILVLAGMGLAARAIVASFAGTMKRIEERIDTSAG